MYKRNCPECENEVKYTYLTYKSYLKAEANGSLCHSCRTSGERNIHYGSCKVGKLNPNYGKKWTTTQCENASKRTSGINNPFYGKSHSIESKQKMSKTASNMPKSNKTKQNMRIAAIARVTRNIDTQMVPGYNPAACRLLDTLAKETRTHIQHAENSGEFHIKELGYWVDGYDTENNIVYEVDEKHHDRQKEKDMIRQQEIIDLLTCKFVRIDI